MSTFNEEDDDDDFDDEDEATVDDEEDWMSASDITLAAVGSPPPALMSFRLISKISNGTSRDDKKVPRARPPSLPMAFRCNVNFLSLLNTSNGGDDNVEE